MSNDSQKEVSIGFHKAIHFGFIPWIVISSCISLIISFEQNGEYAYLDVISFIGASVLGIICFIGFFGWKQYAWYTMQILIWFMLVNNSIVFLVYLALLPDAIASVTPPVVYAILGVTVVRKYYIKLKPRFFPDDSKPNTLNQEQVQNNTYIIANDGMAIKNEGSQPAQIDNIKTISFCRRCGKKALNNALFCSGCGVKLDWRENK